MKGGERPEDTGDDEQEAVRQKLEGLNLEDITSLPIEIMAKILGDAMRYDHPNMLTSIAVGDANNPPMAILLNYLAYDDEYWKRWTFKSFKRLFKYIPFTLPDWISKPPNLQEKIEEAGELARWYKDVPWRRYYLWLQYFERQTAKFIIEVEMAMGRHYENDDGNKWEPLTTRVDIHVPIITIFAFNPYYAIMDYGSGKFREILLAKIAFGSEYLTKSEEYYGFPLLFWASQHTLDEEHYEDIADMSPDDSTIVDFCEWYMQQIPIKEQMTIDANVQYGREAKNLEGDPVELYGLPLVPLTLEGRISIGKQCSYVYCSNPIGDDAGRCSRCKAAVYCSRECQEKAWPAHRADCNAQ